MQKCAINVLYTIRRSQDLEREDDRTLGIFKVWIRVEDIYNPGCWRIEG